MWFSLAANPAVQYVQCRYSGISYFDPFQHLCSVPHMHVMGTMPKNLSTALVNGCGKEIELFQPNEIMFFEFF